MIRFCGIIAPLFRKIGPATIVQKVIYGIGALLALLVIIGFALPRTHQIEVTAEIDAHPATVFALVNDFRRIALWSPWQDTDPDARYEYTDSLRGEGATVTWDGAVLGTGSQTIVKSEPYAYVGMMLNPGEPGEAKSWFQLQEGVGTTLVTWGFEADHGFNLVGRYFASMLGGIVAREYSGGLQSLKELAESLPGADFSDLEIEHTDVEAVDIAYLPSSSRPESAAMAAAMGAAYFQILRFIDANNLSDSGPPLSIIHNFSGAELAFDAAIPIRGLSDDTPRDNALVRIGKTYAGPVVQVRHIGSYEQLGLTHRKISAYLAALGIERNGAAWESFVSDPGQVAEHALVTRIIYPVKATSAR